MTGKRANRLFAALAPMAASIFDLDKGDAGLTGLSQRFNCKPMESTKIISNFWWLVSL